MIITVHLLRGGGLGGWFLYNDNTIARFARFGSMLPQENCEKIVLFGTFLFISGSDFVLNNFLIYNLKKKVMILTGHLLWKGGGVGYFLK